MKKLFFSGAHGVIGKHFVNTYQTKYIIDTPTRNQLDLTDTAKVFEYINDSSYDCLIHGANVGGTRKSTLSEEFYFYQNIKSFQNLYRHISKVQKWIQLGSGAEYGRPIMAPNISETALSHCLPQDAYGLSKYICSQQLDSQKVAKSATLHIFGLFAPGEDYQIRFISNAIVRALHGLPIVIKQNIKMDYVFIEDFIRILQCFIDLDYKYTHYNIGTGQSLYLTDIAEIVKGVVNTQIEIIVLKKAPIHQYTCSNERLKDFLGTSFQFTNMETAIKKMTNYYQSIFDSLKIDWITNPI